MDEQPQKKPKSMRLHILALGLSHSQIKANIIIIIIINIKSQPMPKQITDFKQFLEITKATKSKDSKTKAPKRTVLIKKNKRITKFKIRRGKYLYTFKTNKDDLAKRLEDNLDGNQFEKVLIKNRVIKKSNKK